MDVVFAVGGDVIFRFEFVEAGQSFAFGLGWLLMVQGGMGDFNELGFFHVVNELFD